MNLRRDTNGRSFPPYLLPCPLFLVFLLFPLSHLLSLGILSVPQSLPYPGASLAGGEGGGGRWDGGWSRFWDRYYWDTQLFRGSILGHGHQPWVRHRGSQFTWSGLSRLLTEEKNPKNCGSCLKAVCDTKVTNVTKPVRWTLLYYTHEIQWETCDEKVNKWILQVTWKKTGATLSYSGTGWVSLPGLSLRQHQRSECSWKIMRNVNMESGW